MRTLRSLACLALLAIAPHRAFASEEKPAAPAAAAKAERIVWIDGKAGRLRVSDGGLAGPAVVFLHGLGSDLEAWRAQLDHLRGAGRRAIAYDQRGHGGSQRASDGVYTIEALTDDLEAVRIGLGLDRIVIVGHSMSGEILTTYAGRHPDRVAGLVYVDAMGDAHALPRDQVAALVARETGPGFGAAERRAVFEEMLAPARPATRAKVLASLDRIDPPAFGKLRKALLEFVDGKARYAPYHGPAAAIEVAGATWPGSASVVLGIPRTEVANASHWVQLDQPEPVNRALDAFLAKLPAPAR
jgi:pimeloyl-ACP methyl ester carboxylesterase